ncbi:MAG: metallophosphoesterase [Lentisphaeria bacterium]|nr:metallophosphoesterase [Lentisphaeria bacterium]
MLKNIRCFVTLLFCLIAVNSTALEIIRKNLDLPGWQEAHRNLKIMYITDLHLREEVIKQSLFTKELPDAVKKEKPDLLLIGGDLFHYRPDDYSPIKKDFQKILDSLPEIPCGIYAILGNHEETLPIPAIEFLSKTKIRLLRNSYVNIRFNGETLLLCGLKDQPEKKTSLDKNMRKKLQSYEKPVLVLSHRPAIFPHIPAEKPILILAGHTHGGVVHLPGLSRGKLAGMMKHGHTGKYVYGWFEEGRKKMYVSAGMGGKGYSGFRFNNPPEVLVLTFRKK